MEKLQKTTGYPGLNFSFNYCTMYVRNSTDWVIDWNR